MKPGGDGGLLPAILASYEATPGALPVELLVGAGDRAALLRDGRADVGLLHRPYSDLRGLDTEDLLEERQVVLLPPGHRLAGRSFIRLSDLRGDLATTPTPSTSAYASRSYRRQVTAYGPVPCRRGTGHSPAITPDLAGGPV